MKKPKKPYKAFKAVSDFKKGYRPLWCIGEYVTYTEAKEACLNDIKEVEKTYNKEVLLSYISKKANRIWSTIINDIDDEQGAVFTQYSVLIPGNAPYTLIKDNAIQGYYYSTEEAINYLNKIAPSNELHNPLNILTEKENLENSPLYNERKPILGFKIMSSTHHYDVHFDFYFLYKN